MHPREIISWLFQAAEWNKYKNRKLNQASVFTVTDYLTLCKLFIRQQQEEELTFSRIKSARMQWIKDKVKQTYSIYQDQIIKSVYL